MKNALTRKEKGLNLLRKVLLIPLVFVAMTSGAQDQAEPRIETNTAGPVVLQKARDKATSAKTTADLLHWLGPIVLDGSYASDPEKTSPRVLGPVTPWTPVVSPLLESLSDLTPEATANASKQEPTKDQSEVAEQATDELEEKSTSLAVKPAEKEAPQLPKIVILIDDLGYNRKGMEAALDLPPEVALAILPSTPFALKTAEVSQQQKRITLLHAPMENQRELKLGPGGLYANMTEQELKNSLIKDIDSLPGIVGVNNHMGSLLTTKQTSMNWVMETLQERSLFFIDSLTSPKSVAQQTAQDYGLRTVSRDVFLDNIRNEKAIDKQFNRLLKTARSQGVALAIGHPYPETMAYLHKRLQQIDGDGVQLAPLTDILIVPSKKLAQAQH
ncbi:divergent polysaccharide deacetylase family protein [Marinomonas dokdonensis]|uniref:divergent polysaccharide deacetylase family protein n=1 Tax=Marinomonas dokdonensis TaxID=328224 RepID=UPI004055761C